MSNLTIIQGNSYLKMLTKSAIASVIDTLTYARHDKNLYLESQVYAFRL